MDSFFVRDKADLVMTGGDVQIGFSLEGGTSTIDGGLLGAQFHIAGDANLTISEVTVAWEFLFMGSRLLPYMYSSILWRWIIVSQNIDGRVGRRKIRCHRDIRSGSRNCLDGTGVG